MSEKIKRIGVLTSGGDAPGMNAAVRAVVRTAGYHDIKVFGINRGYDGLINGDIIPLNRGNVANIIHRGGTFLKTARSDDFRTIEGRKKAFETLNAYDIEGLVVVGGNGTYTGANLLCKEYDIKVVGIPGTIDNDIYGTDFTIGFDTAINTAVEAVDKIRDTADSHNRLFFIEVMGRHSGYIALHTAIGSGASAVFIPEHDVDLGKFVENLKKAGRRNKLFNLVIIAEGNKNGGAYELSKKVKDMYPEIDAKATIIGHLQRGGSPTANDRVLASQLGYEAVNALLKNISNHALGLVSNELKLTSFEDAISLRKDPEKNMIEMAEILSM